MAAAVAATRTKRQGASSPSVLESRSPSPKQPSAKKQLLGLTRYKEDWYNMSRVLYPKSNRLEKVKQKQDIYLIRQSDDKALSKSFIHGSKSRVNRLSYFQPIPTSDHLIESDSGEENEEDPTIADENTLPRINPNKSGQRILSSSLVEDETHPKSSNVSTTLIIPLSIGGGSSPSISKSSTKLPEIAIAKPLIPSKSEIKVTAQQQLTDQLLPAIQPLKNTKKQSSLFSQFKQAQQQQLQPEQAAVRFGSSIQDKYRSFVSNLSQTEQRVLSKIEHDASIQDTFDVLLGIKYAAIAGLLTKFYRLCVERVVVALPGQKPFKYTPVDPQVLKNISLSESMASAFLTFFLGELKRSEFSNEKDAFSLMWRQLCSRHLLVDESLVSLGGARELEAMIRNIIDKISRHFGVPMSNEEKDNKSRMAVGLFQGNPSEQLQILMKLIPLKSVRITAMDLFTVKHFIYKELSKEGSVQWVDKVRVLAKVESLRYDYFRDIYQLPRSEEIIDNMRVLMPISLAQTMLEYSTPESIAVFLKVFESNLLGQGNVMTLVEQLNSEGIYVGSVLSSHSLISIEHIMSSGLSRCRQAGFQPQFMKAVLQYRFIALRRKIGTVGNFDAIFEQIDDILDRFHAYNVTLFKYAGIDESERKKYLDTHVFEQILIEIIANMDAFALDDAVFGIKYSGIGENQFKFWVKSLKRILIDMKMSRVMVSSLADYLCKVFNDAVRLLY